MGRGEMPTAEEDLADELGLDVIARLHGGERGAVEVRASDGATLVLKVFPLDEADGLARALEVAARVRARGVPVPDPYWMGTTSRRAYTLQQRCDGAVPEVFEDAHAAQMLHFWAAHHDAVPEGGDWPERAKRALLVGDIELFAVHEPVRAAGGEAAALLGEIIDVASSADPSVLRRTDAMHRDWHHRNLLVRGETVTAVIDWEAARAGDARLDLVLLTYWTGVYAGSGVSREAHERVSAFTAARVEPDARRALAALVALHQLWFVSALRPERLNETVTQVRRELAPHWNGN
jgi:aminoglycoside phosphotransferase (APT) family kinase protein